ncbi:sigma-70 family RNA polymerase sigma factor [Actinomadura nitritigenes]|uniref:sigma-70 family RNA polymerase sigma factor n=1 Tax=Actinomadura nitritigenes TaxID=134602 RepID=UPI003D8DA5D2
MRQDFLDFFDAEYLLVVRFMMRMGACLADAEDAAQYMAMQGWRKVQKEQWDQVTNPPAWARKVALNHHRAQHRDRTEVPLATDVDPPASGPGHTELSNQARDVVALLQRLDSHSRVVIACDLDDIPSADIAAMLGITQQKVRDLRAKARRQLAVLLPHPRTLKGGDRGE